MKSIDGDLTGRGGAARREFLTGASLGALVALLGGGMPANAARRGLGRSRPSGAIVLEVYGYQIKVQQLDEPEPLIGLEVAPIDDLDNLVYSSTQRGTLTDDMAAQIVTIGETELTPDDVLLFDAILRNHNLFELALPLNVEGEGYGKAFLLVLLLFILLVIIGAGFG